MPQTTPRIKVDAVKSMGAEVVLAGDNYDQAKAHCDTIVAETGMTFIHPFDDPLVIAGQGTIGAEILRHSQDRVSRRCSFPWAEADSSPGSPATSRRCVPT